MKRLLITGGSGFIGRNLREQLNGVYSIFAPSHAELDFLDEGQIHRFIKNNDIDVVIHAALWNPSRESRKYPSRMVYNDLRMYFNLARCSDDYEKMIYFGSGAECDGRIYTPRMSENYFDTQVPVDGYGFSKYIMAKYTEHKSNIYNLRFFGVFGKYEDWRRRFISNAICKAILDLPITINQNIFFDYMYVKDFVKITEWFIEKDAKENVYNICTGMTFDLMTLAKKVITVSQKDLDILVFHGGLKKEYSGDNSKLLEEIGDYSFQNIDNCIQV